MALTIHHERNNVIDIFRYIFAVCVVLFHCEALSEISPALNFCLWQTSARIAVPFFLCVTGYYFSAKLESATKSPLLTFLCRQLAQYGKWSLFYFFIVLFALRDESFSIIDYLKQCVLNFCIFGSWYHLWYIPAMLFSAFVFWGFFRFHKIQVLSIIAWFLFLVGCLCTGYHGVGIKIPLISLLLNWKYATLFIRYLCRALPFFTLGGAIYKYSLVKHLLSICHGGYWWSLSIILTLFCLELFVLSYLKIMDAPINTLMLMPLIGVSFMVMLGNPLPQCRKLGRLCGISSSFVYFVHPAIILFLNKGAALIGGDGMLCPTVLAILTVIIASFSCFALNMVKKYALSCVTRQNIV